MKMKSINILIIVIILFFKSVYSKSISKELYFDKTLAMFVGACGATATGYEYVKMRNPDGSFVVPYRPWLGLPDYWFQILRGTLGGSTYDEYNYFPIYDPSRPGIIYSDDDEHVEVFNQYIMDKHGIFISYEDIKNAWLYYELSDFGATDNAIQLLKEKNLIAPQMGIREFGNLSNWLPEGYIEHEMIGAAFPGMPYLAAYYAKKFNSMTSEGEPAEWGMFWAAATAIAYFETDVREVLRKALNVLPGNSYVRAIHDICYQLYNKYPNDWRAAVHELWSDHIRYPCYIGDFDMNVANANNGNAILAALYGNNNYMETLRISSLAGGDGECSASAICGIMGILKGMAGTPSEFVNEIYRNGTGVWRNGVDFALSIKRNFPIDIRITDIINMFQRNAERSINSFGGFVGDTYYNIPDVENFVPAAVSSDNYDFEKGNLYNWNIWNSPGSSNSVWAELQWFNQNNRSAVTGSGFYKGTIVTNPKTSECKLYQNITNLKPETYYFIIARLNSADGREARLFVEDYGGEYKFSSYNGRCSYHPFPFKKLYFKTGLINTTARIGLHAPSTSANSTWCNIDDLQIIELPPQLIYGIYEIENAQTDVGTVGASVFASGGKYLKKLTEAGNYFFINNIYVPDSGEYILKIHYSNTGSNALYGVYINDRYLGNAEFGGTGEEVNISGNFIDVYAKLNSGLNTLRLVNVRGTVQFDCVKVIKEELIPTFQNITHSIPGKIEAEDFKYGGDGVGYRDITPMNEGSMYRKEGVDIEMCSDTGGGYNVGWTKAGEWIAYNVNVLHTGNYNMRVRVANNGTGGTFYVTFNGVNVSEILSIPNTGGWQNWQDLTVPVTLNGGIQEMRIVMVSEGEKANVGNFNYIDFSYINTTPTWTRTSTPSLSPTPSRTSTPTYSRTPTPSSSPSPSRTPTPTYSRTPTPSASNTATSTPSRTATPTYSRTPTPTYTSSRTQTPTFTYTDTISSNTPTATPTFTNTRTVTPAWTNTASPLFTNTQTSTPTYTSTSTQIQTYTSTHTQTPTFTYTDTLSSNTPTMTPTYTRTYTLTSTRTQTPTLTYTDTISFNTTTATPTYTRTWTITLTWTNTATPSSTNTRTLTPTNTRTPTVSYTATLTVTPSFTATRTRTLTFTFTSTLTLPPTMTVTPTLTNTPVISGQLVINNLIIYPNPYNPNKGDLRIRVEIEGISKIARVKIYTMGFRMIKQVTVVGNYVQGANTIDIDSRYLMKLANGTYYIVVSMVDERGKQVNSKPQVLIVLK